MKKEREIAAWEVPALRRTEVIAVRWIAQLQGRPWAMFRVGEDGEVRSIRNRELRRLIALKCIELMGVSPARYRVTRIGRLAAGLGRVMEDV